MIFDLLLLMVGLGLLLGGGYLLVRGASDLAQNLGVSPLVVGLTVVAFGTSAPELAVNTIAALKGTSDISFGNIIGSNIANIGLILACAALIRPLDVKGSVISREIPMMLLATTAALIMGFDQITRGGFESYDRGDALLLLLLFAVFLYYTVGDVLRQRAADAFVRQTQEATASPKRKSIGLNLLFTIVGLMALVGGARLAVDASVHLARAFHVPQVVIGITLVAVGTSLPELATSAIATWRGQTDLAIGNVVGSNIFNLLFIKGISATIRPIPVPARGHTDLIMMMGLSAILLPLSISDRHRITRIEGGLLLAIYFGYMLWRTLSPSEM